MLRTPSLITAVLAVALCFTAQSQQANKYTMDDLLKADTLGRTAWAESEHKYLLETPRAQLKPCGYQRAGYEAARKAVLDAGYDSTLIPKEALMDLNMCEDMMTEQGAAFALRIQRSEQAAALHNEKLRERETKP